MIEPGVRTTVHLLRHGEVFNPSGVLYGRLPGFRLSEDGVRMAEVSTEWLSSRKADITYLVASPLERAQQTAAPASKAFGLEIVADHRVIESENVFEGSTVEFGPGAIRDPKLWKHIYNPFKPSWGEEYAKVSARVLDAVDDARRAAEGHEALIVSHQLPIYVTRRRVQGQTLWHRPDRRQCALASLTSLVYDGDTLVRVDYVEPNGPGVKKKGSVGA